MPVNEILAASTAIMKYNVGSLPIHQVRLYFDAVPSVNGDGEFSFPTYTDAGHLTGWTLAEIWDEVWTRLALDNTRTPTIAVQEVEVWESVAGVNTFLGIDASDYTGVTGGLASSIAAAYAIRVFKASNRAQFRLAIFDTGDAKPQVFSFAPPPASDNTQINWFMCRSAVGFVTNDNLPLVTMATQNTGYNRKLARSYGRTVQP